MSGGAGPAVVAAATASASVPAATAQEFWERSAESHPAAAAAARFALQGALAPVAVDWEHPAGLRRR